MTNVTITHSSEPPPAWWARLGRGLANAFSIFSLCSAAWVLGQFTASFLTTGSWVT